MHRGKSWSKRRSNCQGCAAMARSARKALRRLVAELVTRPAVHRLAVASAGRLEVTAAHARSRANFRQRRNLKINRGAPDMETGACGVLGARATMSAPWVSGKSR